MLRAFASIHRMTSSLRKVVTFPISAGTLSSSRYSASDSPSATERLRIRDHHSRLFSRSVVASTLTIDFCSKKVRCCQSLKIRSPTTVTHSVDFKIWSPDKAFSEPDEPLEHDCSTTPKTATTTQLFIEPHEIGLTRNINAIGRSCDEILSLYSWIKSGGLRSIGSNLPVPSVRSIPSSS